MAFIPLKQDKSKIIESSGFDFDGSFNEEFLSCHFCALTANKMGIVIEDNKKCKVKKGSMYMNHDKCPIGKHPGCTDHCLLPPNWSMSYIPSTVSFIMYFVILYLGDKTVSGEDVAEQRILMYYNQYKINIKCYNFGQAIKEKQKTNKAKGNSVLL